MSEDKERVSQDLLTRLRRIEGQVRGLQRMIEEETECGQILNQVAAVRSALNKVGMIMFQHHSRECIAKAVGQEGQQERIDEIVTLMGRLIK
ncbi:MAG TPA: transcriptional regulator [Syntrophomonas sp.]|jgi:DNA-binding FrmR family transcriptional regulator|nr:transcriptional regulator [Syntrophomonas sp.]